MVEGLSVKSRFLVRFQDRCDKDLTSDRFTVVAVDRITATEESEVKMISAIPDEKVYFGKGYYYGVYVLIKFL